MIKKIIEYIFLNKKKCLIGIILFTYLLFIIWFSFNDISVWWDESVYIGMGKYISSFGSLGMWEIFRPPLLPLIYAFLFKLNAPLILAGKVIVIISSLGSLWLAYTIGESIKKGSGIFCSIFLMITPVFFLYSRVPMTDVVSIFFALATLYFFSKEKYLLTGILISLTFLLRFSQCLIILPIGITLIYETYNKNYILWVKELFVKMFFILLGFSILVVPYLISNNILYGNILEPFILANRAVSLSSEVHDLGKLYYAKELLVIAPFLYLAVLSPIVFLKKEFFENTKHKKILFLILITALIFLLYFFWQPHKELRYSLAFVPYLAILSSIALVFILEFFKKRKLIIFLFIVSLFFLTYNYRDYFKDNNGYRYIPLNIYLNTLKGSYLSTNPLPVVFGEIKILSLFERALVFKSLFEKNLNIIDGIFIKDCDIFCKEKDETGFCYKDLVNINDIINKSKFKKSYEVVIDQCTFSVYNK
jgi:4-amino-4-deoxy-L-arabinose transferase-like glycosyltransferase